jgi:threonine dehydratase
VLDESFQTALKISEAKGLLFVHPFMDADVIAGQGTAALEILDDKAFAGVEAIVIPIGGGGLFAGCATAIRARHPKLKIYGVVAQNAPTMHHSFKKKAVEKVPVDYTLADGVATKQAHPEMLELILALADDVLAIPEESISHAISLLAEEAKIIAEGAGALSVAAILDDRITENNVVCMISGGNVDIPALSKVLYRGLVAQGRLIRVIVTISDRPGGLHKLTGALSELGANILQVFHHRSTLRVGIGQTQLEVELETRDPEHTKEIIETLRAKSWKVDRVF